MSTQPLSERVASLDAFRGFAIASMVLVNNPGYWGHLYAPLAHAKWDGWTFTDLVFPFFLFAAGMSMAISIDRRARAGDTPGAIMRSIARRAAVIFLVGLGLNLFPTFDFSTVRIPGVLQRIALCVLIAAPLAIRVQSAAIAAWSVMLLCVYSYLMLFVPVVGPDGVVATGALEPGRDFGAWLDRLLMDGHLWAQAKTWDPEGLVSTLPAIASTLFGVMAGRWLLTAPATLATSFKLAAAGALGLLAGTLLDSGLMPINKSLWTPSYCVFTTGWSLVVFAAFHATMDGTKEPLRTYARRLLLPLTIYGMNALFIFALSGLVARILVVANWKAPLFAVIQTPFMVPENASLAYAVVFNLAMFAVAWFMWKQKWFIKA
jgi:predicted acyltransferase